MRKKYIWIVALVVAFLLISSQAFARKWTDVTGKFSVEAVFVELNDGNAVLKKNDGTTINVPLEKLSKADRDYIESQEKRKASTKPASTPKLASKYKSESSKAGSTTPAPPSDAPLAGAFGATSSDANVSLLEGAPSGLEWPQNLKKEIDAIPRNYKRNPVSTALRLADMNQAKKNGAYVLSGKERIWTEAAAKAAKPAASEILQRDFREAISDGDLRRAILAETVAKKLDGDPIEGSTGAILVLKTKILSGPANSKEVWELTNVKGELLKGNISDGSVTLKPEKGFVLLAVKASCKNVSDESDPPYSLWAFHPFKRIMLPLAHKGEEESDLLLTAPRRVAATELLFLVTASGDMISCLYVRKSDALSGSATMLPTKDPKSRHVYGGSLIASGNTFEMDVVFNVPEGIDDFRLLFLGSKLVPVEMAIKEAK